MEDIGMVSEYLLHIPHSSINIPLPYQKHFLINPESEFPYMTDWYTDELFDLPAQKLVFPASRLVCDVERFREDRQEVMAGCGMGACYTHTHDGRKMRHLTADQRESILRHCYDPHHVKLTRMTNEILTQFGRCIIIDCHSFSPVPLPYEPEQDPDRPDICIGTDPFHTPSELAGVLVQAFRSRGYSVCVNKPYSGSIVPMDYYCKNPQVISVMIEVNRGLYLNDSYGKNNAFSLVSKDIRSVFLKLTSKFPTVTK